MTYDLVAPLRFDGLGSEGYPAYAATDILQRITVGAGTDDMTEAEIADTVAGRSDADRIEEVSITVDFKAKRIVLEALNPYAQWRELIGDTIEEG
jgi:hypothetical protein